MKAEYCSDREIVGTCTSAIDHFPHKLFQPTISKMSSSEEELILKPNRNTNKRDSNDNDDDSDNDSDNNHKKSTDNKFSDFKQQLESNFSNILKPNKGISSSSTLKLSSENIATQQKFTYLPNIELDFDKKEEQQKLFVQHYPPLPGCEEETDNEEENNEITIETKEEEFIQIPNLTKSILDKAKVDFRAENFSNFYDGIIQNMKKKYGSSNLTQFVKVFADTKKKYKTDQKFVNRLINSDLKKDWYSTHLISHPSITIFFPYHQISLKYVSFRAHENTNFGPNFIHKFRVYGIYDDKTVKCLSAFDSTAINDFEVKANYSVSSHDPIRGIHIVSDSGKFGLTAIELFGSVSFNQCQTSFSEKFLTNPETYENEKVPNPIKDSKQGRKSFVKKIKTAFKTSMIIPVSDDDEKYEEEAPKMVEKKVVEKGPIQSYDPFDSDLCKILKRRYDYTVFPESSYEHFHEGRKYFCVSLDIATVRLTGINIKTYGETNGFIFYGAKAESGKLLEWEHIFSSKKETCVSHTRGYLYPINNPKEYSHFLIRSYSNKFTIKDIEFYGRAIKKKVAEDCLFTCTKTIFNNPPTGVFTDTQKPGIFESMKNYYGAALYGFVTIKTKVSDGSIGRIYLSESIESQNRNFSCVLYYFHQHCVKISTIRYTTPNHHRVKDLYIFGGSSVSTIIHRYHTVFAKKICTYQIQNSEPIDFIAVCNFGDSFYIDNLELFGTLEKNEVQYKRIGELQQDFEYIQKTVKMQVMKMIISQQNDFRKELLSAVEKNPRVVFSVQHGKSYKDDILSYGLKTFKDFVTLYNYGDNGYSILKGDPKNKWETTRNQYEDSFTVLFKHHSVCLTKFKLKTTEDEQNLSPDQFYLFGYNTKLKRWDVLLEQLGQQLKSDSYYSFDVKEDCKAIPYRMFEFYSLTGTVSLSMIELFGDLIEDNSPPPVEEARKSVTTIDYTTKPAIYTSIEKDDEKFTHGFLRNAMKIYGPRLKNFVRVNCHCLENNFFHEIWGASKSTYISISSKSVWEHTISFFFPYHEVFISGYHIQSGDVNGISNWAVIGCVSNDDCGTIIDTQRHKVLSEENSYYRYHTKDFENTSFRIIRFVAYEYAFYFNCLDFFGIVRPVPSSKYLTEENMDYEKQELPSEVHQTWRYVMENYA